MIYSDVKHTYEQTGEEKKAGVKLSLRHSGNSNRGMSRQSSRSRGNSIRNKVGADKTKETEPSPFKKVKQGGANNLKIKSQRTTDSVPNSYEVQS